MRAPTPTTPPGPPPVGSRDVHEVSDEGSAMLDLLVELGHLDDPLLAELSDQLLDLQSDTGLVGIQDVRRLAATIIFEHSDTFDSDQLRVLKQEWPLLFW